MITLAEPKSKIINRRSMIESLKESIAINTSAAIKLGYHDYSEYDVIEFYTNTQRHYKIESKDIPFFTGHSRDIWAEIIISLSGNSWNINSCRTSEYRFEALSNLTQEDILKWINKNKKRWEPAEDA